MMPWELRGVGSVWKANVLGLLAGVGGLGGGREWDRKVGVGVLRRDGERGGVLTELQPHPPPPPHTHIHRCEGLSQ